MTTQEISELIENLRSMTEAEEASWSVGSGKTRYETVLDGKILIFYRYNNIENDQLECYVKVGDFENVYGQDDEEFDLISEFVSWL